MITGARHLAAVLTWKPLAATAVLTIGWLVVSEHPSPLSLTVAAAAVAAAAAFVLDDTAAPTLQSSPAPLLRRRAHRAAIVLSVVGSWWALAIGIVARSAGHVPMAEHTLQLVTLVAVGLAGASTTVRYGGDGARGGITGAVAVIICFGTSFLPARSLQLVPSDPEASRRLGVVLVVAIAIQLWASADPAGRVTPLRRTSDRSERRMRETRR